MNDNNRITPSTRPAREPSSRRAVLVLFALPPLLAACQGGAARLASAPGAGLPAATQAANPAQLVAAQAGRGAVRLQDGPDAARAIMARVLDLGEVRAVTRNADAQLDTTGVPKKLGPVKPRGGQTLEQAQAQREKFLRVTAGGYIGGPIDLRFDFDRWAHAFAVTSPGRDGAASRSLQFFDAQGQPVHEVHLVADESIARFDQLVADLRATGEAAAQTRLALQPPAPAQPDLPDAQIDAAGYQLAWRAITDVHQFHGIQQKFKVGREQAMRLAPPGATRQLPAPALRRLVEGAVQGRVPIMAFVGNTGLTHVYSGMLEDAQARGEWLAAAGPGARLLLREQAVASGWIATRGDVVSVDFFDRRGEPIVTFFGQRVGSNYHVTPAWKPLVDAL